MIIKFAATKLNTIFKAICILTLSAAFLIFSDECRGGALKGIELCIKILIPSLFPFMALSSFIADSGIFIFRGKTIDKIMKFLFGIPACFTPIILLSIIGGYPIGAKGISSLYSSSITDEKNCRKAALFAVCAGPGFLINFVGACIYSSTTIGWILFTSQFLSVIIIGIGINIFSFKKNNDYQSNTLKKTLTKPTISNSIVKAAYDSSKGMFNISAFVVLFSAFIGIIDSIMEEGVLKSCVLSLLEVCTAVERISKDYCIEAVAFAIGFGGLCVHFQIFSALSKIRINKLIFFSVRIIQGTITALITHILLSIIPESKSVFSTSSVKNFDIYGNNIFSVIALIAVAICFLYSLKNIRQHTWR